MNEDQALKLLQGGREGIIEWNRRVAGGDKIPSLHGANLGESDLIDTELQGACLAGANLAGADLGTATLVGADLRNADLHEADLSNASLFTANLTKANLEDADLSGADLGHANLASANLNGADLEGADLSNANLCRADLGYADLEDANLANANLVGADLSNATLVDTELTDANLADTNLSGANMSDACLAGANLHGANLTRAVLGEANLKNASLNGCSVHEMSAWDVELDGATQASLDISRLAEPTICVDGLDVARFLDMMIHKEQVRDVIDTITCKVVLILGSFKEERATVLDAIREGLRRHDLCPVSFDSERSLTPESIRTVSTLVHLVKFVVADVTDSTTALEGVTQVVRDGTVPVKPLLCEGSGDEPTGLNELRGSRGCLLATHRYGDAQGLLSSFEEQIIVPAQAMADELRDRRAGRGLGHH